MTLYSLRSADGSYRIQKFDADLNPLFDSSYLISEGGQECSCPAGHRKSCRHRQMLGSMLKANLLDSPDFWNHDLNRVEPSQERSEATGHKPLDPATFTSFEPHSTTVSATDFESVDDGSNPSAAAKFKRRF